MINFIVFILTELYNVAHHFFLQYGIICTCNQYIYFDFGVHRCFRLTANVAIWISFKSALTTMCRSNSNANFVCKIIHKGHQLYNRSSILSNTTVQIESTSATNCGSRPYKTSLESTPQCITWDMCTTGTTSKIDNICLMYDTSMGSASMISPSTSNVAGKSLTTIDAALRQASAEI
ncbi:hypothetical protein AGLY_004311 [Aphis glycines]|uniref:Uncharacterized protein n=1 Tax=Aphis glycines TaxID=307491 RepID=A0A6G0TXS8_APHGL|nr:hypothetical protein AGLY_004311 [Aphis glycines]